MPESIRRKKFETREKWTAELSVVSSHPAPISRSPRSQTLCPVAAFGGIPSTETGRRMQAGAGRTVGKLASSEGWGRSQPGRSPGPRQSAVPVIWCTAGAGRSSRGWGKGSPAELAFRAPASTHKSATTNCFRSPFPNSLARTTPVQTNTTNWCKGRLSVWIPLTQQLLLLLVLPPPPAAAAAAPVPGETADVSEQLVSQAGASGSGAPGQLEIFIFSLSVPLSQIASLGPFRARCCSAGVEEGSESRLGTALQRHGLPGKGLFWGDFLAL
ncbi:uncharacterized protein LOC123234012 [Gracilinanus agilis]|uniref:uncharacterized protein LOC123234012 n=1 Tax=Gracilinanus agilis TaxID=191870 RepID=UPI001CFCCF6D|nr:uncharacterized protein LOC123234012 [Gracilinanus agilis]